MKPRPPVKFEIYRDKKGQFRFRGVAANGERVLQGEGYTRKAAAREALDLLVQAVTEGVAIMDLTGKWAIQIAGTTTSNLQMLSTPPDTISVRDSES